MTDQIFASEAPHYFAQGIPVIPLHVMDKRPILRNWQKYHETMPDPDEQQAWLEQFPDANIGLVLGEQSGICVLDIDTTDEELIKLITKILPDSPWVRIGKKGMVLAFKYDGQKTFRIKLEDGSTVCELLSSRTQVVLPPSIHPETRRPYVANCQLYEVLDKLQPLVAEFEAILRGAFKDAGIPISLSGWTKTTEKVSIGSRDVSMIKVAGHYAYGVIRGELSLFEAIERMYVWNELNVERVAGDDVDIEKGIRNLVQFLSRDVIEKKKILPEGWDEGLTPEDKTRLGLEFSEDHEEWPFEKLKEYLHGAFESHPPESPGRMTAINYVVDKISKAKNLNRLDEDRLLRYITEAGGMRLNLTSLRARIKELSNGDMRGKDHTEIAKATIEEIEKISPLRFYAQRFWQWGGSHWEILPNIDILKVIANEFGHLDAARRNSDHQGILRVMSSLVVPHIKTLDVRGVNFANGLLLESLQLVPHNLDFGMTYTLPFEYKPELNGKAFRFMDFLESCWSSDVDKGEKFMALQEALCSTVFGRASTFQRAVLLYGPAKTGKSQMLRIAQALVPDNARASCPPDTWGDKFAPATMHEKLINTCGELSHNKRIDGQKFKSIVDGEEMSGQFKGQQIFSFRPRCMHWFASNHQPATDDTSEGFNRRWLILNFKQQVTAERRVLDLGDLIAAEEREAIVAWAVEAMPRLAEQRDYTLPKSHKEIIEDVANSNNSVRFFIKESGMVRVDPSLIETSPPIVEMKLHNAYWSFCLGAGGARAVGARPFRQQMRDLQAEMNFEMRPVMRPGGFQEFLYYGLTLVERPVS